MEAVTPISHPAGRARGFSDSYATRPRIVSDKGLVQNGPSPRAGNENRSPLGVSKALESMLKTTTETGDIGMFSIKPSRVPQSASTPRRLGGGFNENGPQKPRQTFQPYGVPVIDDRRRLPSYAKDVGSEVVSMYETASQKSGGRGFEDPDYRSYSMTQTSYSSYTLSNHRSYASLRSQADPLVQRPRSPFAYPARLKRPGFRPSSPALTDGGLVDYSRRAEIERFPGGAGYNTSSPSSLYARKRRPPGLLRAEANRSTPSLLSQQSSPRRSSSPLVPQSNGSSFNDSSRRTTTGSVNTSPARSTFSLASTVNLYCNVPAPSVATTPGKLHPPSPLYYDYTEDFEVEEDRRPETFDPPPPFRIEKTIPEDRPMSAEGPPPLDALCAESNDINNARHSNSSTPVPVKYPERRSSATGSWTGVVTPATPIRSTKPASNDAQAHSETSKRDTKVIRLSGLGYGARELSSHVEEAFGLPTSTTFEISVPKAGENDAPSSEEDGIIQNSSRSRGQDTRASVVSSYTLDVKLPTSTSQIDGPSGTNPWNDRQDTRGGSRDSHEFTQLSPKDHKLIDEKDTQKQTLINSPRTKVRSSGFTSINTGLTDLLDIVRDMDKKGECCSSIPLGRTPMSSPTLPDENLLHKASLPRRITPPQSSKSEQRPRDERGGSRIQPLRRQQHNVSGQGLEPVTARAGGLGEVPNFSHQIHRNIASRSKTPLLAPKPISPARQLKLKNSVPQLMKALPPIPSDTLPRENGPRHLLSLDSRKADQFSPLPLDTKGNPFETRGEINTTESVSVLKVAETPTEAMALKASKSMVQEIKGSTTQNALTIQQSPPKLKLKMRNSATFRPMSPPGSRPWNLEESYPWATQTPHVRLPMTPEGSTGNTKQPMFKLRVTRASESTQGTIRVVRDNETTPSTNFNLHSPRDLFSTPTGIDNIFRQVSKHLHSRKTSANSNHAYEDDTNSMSTPILSQMNRHGTPNSEVPSHHGYNPMRANEVRSVFSDDSSQAHGYHSLRGRLSNLKARIAVPYATRGGAQSYDDITWKDRNGSEVTPTANMSTPNIHARASTDGKPMRRFTEKLQRQRLKARVQGWFRGARSAIASRVRARSSGVGDVVGIYDEDKA